MPRAAPEPAARESRPLASAPPRRKSLSQDVFRLRAHRRCVSAAPRDQEALDIAASRFFADAYVASLAVDMQARRLTLRVYGALRRDGATYLATLTFFGASNIVLANAGGVFPQSVHLSSLVVRYEPVDDQGAAELHGASPWTCSWQFDGFAYEEHAAVLASLVDDL